MSGYKERLTIPSFYGEFDPDTYLVWEKEVDSIIKCLGYTAEKQAQLASTGLCGYALEWWYQLANNRRHIGEFQVSSWYEMKAVMKKRFVAKRYGQLDLERLQSQSRSVRARPRTTRDGPRVCYGRGDQKKTHQFGYFHSQQFQDVRQEIQQAVNALVQDQQRRPHCDTLKSPVIQAPEGDKQIDEKLVSWSIQHTISKNTEQTYTKPLSKPAEKDHESAPEPATPCQGDYVANHLKQEERSQVMCDHVPDQTKKEEGVLGESSTAHELMLALVGQGDNFQILTCELLIRPMVCLQPSLVEYLRDVKGLQQVVFEPGGSFSVSTRSNNNLVQETVSYKLDLQCFFTPEKQDLRSNLFEGREDGVILSSCSKNRGETGGNTSLISPITDQNQMRSTKKKLVVVKKMPKLENEYGDHYTRPPDYMQHENQFIISIGQGVLREIRGILLGSHKELVRPPDQSARFLFVFVCYILRHVRNLEMIEQGSNSFLKHGKRLQCWVFDPGDDHGSIILQDLDLRTNPFEGRKYGAILSRLKLKGLDSWYELDKLLIYAWLNGQFHGLTGMIHEVLDREKRRTLGTEQKQLEQGGVKKHKCYLIGAMETFPPRPSMYEKKENISGSFWSGLDLKLFEKGLYRPKKWKDKPAWFRIGPRRLMDDHMVYFKCIWFYYL